MAALYKFWLLVSASAAFLLFILFAAAPLISNAKLVLFSSSQVPYANQIKASKQNVWADLSPNEAGQVIAFLHSKSDLNLAKAPKAASQDNTVILVEALQPNKTDVLSYLKGTSGAPERWARVVVQTASIQPQIVNYMVGPLPPSENTLVLPLEFCYNADKNYVRNPVPDGDTLQSWQVSLVRNYSDIIETLLGIENLFVIGRATFVENGNLSLWMTLFQNGTESNAFSLLPQGLYVNVDVPSFDSATWKIQKWYYNGVLYASTSALRNAINSPDFEICPHNRDGDWTDPADLRDGDPGRRNPPPVMVQPQGPRFNIDKQQNYVSWMGFEFYISTSSDTGLTLHDIRFNGDSIIYEIGLQEALSHYAGDDPVQGGLEFLDTLFFMGIRMFELVPGYDCPAYSTFLSATFNHGESSTTVSNSICIFEYTADYPLQRHTTDYRVSVSRNTYLIVRSVSTVGNYDYTIEYIFYLDGAIEVKFRASGYIFTSFWPNTSGKRNEYGYKIHDAVASSMHDHVLNFKADLDIDGTANTLTRVAIEPVSLQFSWDNEQEISRNTMHLVSRPVSKEVGIDWPRNSGEMYVVTNENSTNIWGEKRGYRIQPGTGMGTPSHLSILNSTSLWRSAEWASSDIWVVKQKDTEPRSASNLNSLDPLDPLVDFSKFVNGESILQEDLVLYFNLGSHHIPHSGDIPNTLSHTAASSVVFTPFNFHDRDPSRRSVQGVQLELGKQKTEPKYFGGRNDKSVKLHATHMEPDLSQYTHTPRTSVNLTFIDMLLGH